MTPSASWDRRGARSAPTPPTKAAGNQMTRRIVSKLAKHGDGGGGGRRILGLGQVALVKHAGPYRVRGGRRGTLGTG